MTRGRGEGSGSTGSLRTIVLAALSLLAIALACALLVVLADPDRRPAGDTPAHLLGRTVTDWDGRPSGDLSDAHREVATAARRMTLAFLDVDHRNMGPRTRRVLEGATGDFARQYRKARPDLVRTAEENKSRSTGRVVALGVGDLDADSAVVYVAANSEVSNASTQGSRQPRYYRLQLDMVKRGGRWLTSELRFVG